MSDNWTRYFDERYEFRRATDFVIENLTGLNTLEYSLNAEREGGITDPEYLRAADAFAEWYREQPEVTHVQAFPDIMKRLNKNMHGDEEAFYQLPADPALAGQYLLLYELSLPFGSDLNNRIDVAKSATRMTVVVGDSSAGEQRELDARAQAWLSANEPQLASAASGISMIFAHLSQRNIHSMLQGTIIAMALISFILVWVFKSARLGLISLLPNFIPAAMSFGLWGYLIGHVGIAASVVCVVTFGIIVDDTIHFMSKYLKARGEGLPATEAVRSTFRTVGQALWTTTAVLSASFLVFASSGFELSWALGLLVVDHARLRAPRRFFTSPDSADGHRPEEIMTRLHLARSGLLFLASCLAFGAYLGAPPLARSQNPTAEEIGLKIEIDANAHDEGFSNLTANQVMVLRNKQGQESRRQLRVKVLEVTDDGDKSMFVFDEPRDVQGTAMLIHAHKEDADEQWLYLPALKRVKRISSSNRSGSFMGSEFAYEDMSAPEVEKFTYRCLRDEPCGDLTCTVSERVPVDKKSSGYSRQLVWRDRDELRVWKVEYYDRKDAHLKTLTIGNYEQYLDRYWRAGEMTMVNHLTGKSTVLSWTDYQFRTDLNDRDFTQTGLRRVR